MSKTYKDRPEKYNKVKYRKPKEKRFESTKGRKKAKLATALQNDS